MVTYRWIHIFFGIGATNLNNIRGQETIPIIFLIIGFT